jgi:D-alanyl-D-alanine carboxypeptidase/D-alanyl-D-alanine-endopeptidase (penicillin-binding protein 4)
LSRATLLFACLFGLATLAQRAAALDIAPGAAVPDLAGIARATLGADQGVYVESADGRVLLEQVASRAVHPASISKIPTTLALLRRLGPEHRFVTTFAAHGEVRDGALRGDLVVEAGGDPYFVDENALLVLLRLRELGIERVDGALRVRGPLTFNWQPTAIEPRLRQALGGQVSGAAWSAVRGHAGGGTLLGTASVPALRWGAVTAGTATGSNAAPRVLAVHRSQPLLPMVKALNDYSNNVFRPFADAAGGIAAVEQLARDLVPREQRAEIVLGDGAGVNPRNRLSPRVTVRLIRSLEADLARNGHALTDVLPVAGIDDGTLRARLNGPGEAGHVVGKTGTYGDYGACALAGAIRSPRYGTVYFAILNRGIPIVPARRRQDAFLRALMRSVGSEPWPYRRDAAPAFTRAQVE